MSSLDASIFDILIVGGGLAGASLAAALKPSRLSVALVESQPLNFSDSGWDNRIYAISPGNADFLRQIDAWQLLDTNRMQAVNQMRVFGDTGAELNFSAYQMGAPELAFILENRSLLKALWQGLQQQDNLALYHPARCTSITWNDDAALLTLEGGQALCAKLIVGADGSNSWVRQQADMPESPIPYNQHAVVANFSAEKSHQGTAYQWFQTDGVLALLPLPEQHVSMVWSVSSDKARVLSGLSGKELCGQIDAVSGHPLGALHMVTPPRTFPLSTLRLPRMVLPRLALIGDAAHIVHPLAGQGVNLGFRDARQLAQVIMQRDGQPDCGKIQVLRRYERARKEDIVSMQFATDMLKKLFNNSNPLLHSVRNLGLSAVNNVAPLKKMLARQALN